MVMVYTMVEYDENNDGNFGHDSNDTHDPTFSITTSTLHILALYGEGILDMTALSYRLSIQRVVLV